MLHSDRLHVSKGGYLIVGSTSDVGDGTAQHSAPQLPGMHTNNSS